MRRARVSPLLLTGWLAFPLACSKSDPSPVPSPASSIAPAPSASFSAAPAPASASAPAPAPGHAPATTHATAAASAAKPTPTCGDKPLPPCPLRAWMKANTAAALSAGDFEALAAALNKVAGFAPPGYTNWKSIAKDGADAARVEDADAVKASCRGCHNQYKDRYKKEMRDRPI